MGLSQEWTNHLLCFALGHSHECLSQKLLSVLLKNVNWNSRLLELPSPSAVAPFTDKLQSGGIGARDVQ